MTQQAITHSIRALTESTLSEERVFLGQAYLVVPVVAMVEGVRFGAAQEVAELGLASEFGKYPVTWNNVPLVVNHPKNGDSFVSANSSIEVLEEYSFGFTADAKVEDSKLKMQAWISLTRAEEIPEVQAFVDQIKDNQVIEVSVGFFSDVEKKTGTFKSQTYGGVWRNIIPDHLAFLTQGPGACSVKDGCGVPRINQALEEDMTLRNDTPIPQEEKPCSCHNHAPTAPEVLTAAEAQAPETALELSVQAIADTITSDSIYQLVNSALKKHLMGADVNAYCDYYLTTYTAGENSMAVYSLWHHGAYQTKAIRFDLSADGIVTFSGEPIDVRIVSHLYTQENVMTIQEQTGTPKEEIAAVVTQTAAAAFAPAPTPVVQESRVLSRDEALKAMSAEDRELIQTALKAQDDKKNGLIKALKDSGKCTLPDDFLNTQSLNTLEALVALAAQPVETTPVVQSDFSGRTVPVTPIVQADNGFVPAPKVFEVKKTA